MTKCLLQLGKIDKQIWILVNHEVTQRKNYVRCIEFHKKGTIILWYFLENRISPSN